MAIKNLTLAAVLAAGVAGVGAAHASGAHWLNLGPPKIVLSLYGEHVSHLTQHQPFARYPTNYGYNTVNVGITFEEHGTHGGGPFLSLNEGYNLTNGGDTWTEYISTIHVHGWTDTGPGWRPLESNGALLGPREVFSARFGWRWVL